MHTLIGFNPKRPRPGNGGVSGRPPELVAPMSANPPALVPPLDAASMLGDLTDSFRQTTEEVVPWFLEQMPQVYFQDTSPADQMGHLRAIIAAKASGRPIEMTLRSEDGLQWTMMRPADYPGVLAEMVAELPRDLPLQAAKIHTTSDGALVLDTFLFGEPPRFEASDAAQAEKVEQVITYARLAELDFTEDEIRGFCAGCPVACLMNVTPLRLCRHMEMVRSISGTEGSTTAIEPESDPTLTRIILAVGNATTRTMLERIATRLARSEINIHRAYLDVFGDGEHGTISVLGFVVQDKDGGPIAADSELWKNVRRDLRRLKWIDNETLEAAYSRDMPVTRAEIVKGLCHLVHQVLVKENRYAFDRDGVIRLAWRNEAQALDIVQLFLDKFRPGSPLSAEAFEARRMSIRESIDNAVDLEDARTVLHKMVDAVAATLRTNVYVTDRYALSFRIDPQFLATRERAEIPYGVFFVHGRQFDGFHVRFRDIARGGVRAIRPIGQDQHSREVERLYDEAYGLAFAQQLKNKDIPEGGSKAAVLLEPQTRLDRAVKAFINSILDLITPDPDTRAQIVDYFGEDELLYLGPDENITPYLIDWMAERARQRGYPSPTAFISSKPGAGINHKEYGVTSEGVTVFLDVGLQRLGIDPKREPFTVKITGGPDGDVAGNEIRILNRDYGENARIIGIADGSGSAEDPDGLCHEELLRLFRASLPIADFDPAKLGKNGRVTPLDAPDGVHLRNTLHNRLTSDVFVPAGGRPSAIHEGNWREHLDADGHPRSRLIVEGANLFLTPPARVRLSEAGAIIMKDSSANKCGVICSSYEIIACMLLEPEDFMTIKEVFVEQVLTKLRAFARREAELLVRIQRHHPQAPLPEVSVRLSRVMMRTADAIERAITMSEERTRSEDLRRLVLDHLPPVLVETVGDEIWSRLPTSYVRWIMAKTLAARIVYRESFEYLEEVPVDVIAELAFSYLALERERDALITEIAGSDVEHRERISAILSRSGILATFPAHDTY